MLFIFRSELYKVRKNAENWLRLSEKIYFYRRDLLRENELNELLQATANLRDNLQKEADAGTLKLSVERLEDVVRRVGGSYYPKSAMAENIEILLVAAILAIGIRTYIVQPFKIPTNSMWPSYYGMTHEVFVEPKDEPGAVMRGARKLLHGATRVQVEAPRSGRARIPVGFDIRGDPFLPYEQVADRNWLIFPTVKKQYTFFVGNEPVTFKVPVDFVVEQVFAEMFFPTAENLREGVEGRPRVQQGSNLFIVDTPVEASAGDRVLSFDILTGDQLFVDRMSYHFVRPRIGSGFVFRTGEIADMQDDLYYIKRLVGKGADELEIVPPVLYRNGEPINDRKVFRKLNSQEGKYPGYVNSGPVLSAPGRTVTIPPDSYYALGDNSPNSWDSRNWGFVPAQSVIGRPIFIYYPFSSRWGIPK